MMIRSGNRSPQNLVNSLEAGIPRLMQEVAVPGLAISLTREDTILWSRAFGVRHCVSQAPVTPDTVFEAASLSKPLFAYAALKLVENGILDLDKPLVEYVPDRSLPLALPSSGRLPRKLRLDKSQLELVTARQVLSHTAGFPNWPTKEHPLKTHFPPGERFSYSGTGYSVLQSIVEIITGQPAVAFAQANILKPLGMQNSRFVWTGQEDHAVAVGHNENGEPTEKAVWPDMIAGASLHSTTGDLARFMLAVLRPTNANPFHLGPDLTQAMLTPQVNVNDSASWHEDWPKPKIKLNKAVSWGLGWGLQHPATGTSFWHWGDNGNYKHFAIGSRQEGVGIVILTNGKNGQQVYKGILCGLIGGQYPGLDWLMSM